MDFKQIEHFWTANRESCQHDTEMKEVCSACVIEYLIGRVRELDADKRRLDWLEKREYEIHFDLLNWSITVQDDSEGWEIIEAQTLRGVIDDTMAAENPKVV